MPTLNPIRSWVKVWMASTKSASSGDSRSVWDMPSKSGPAGSRPGSRRTCSGERGCYKEITKGKKANDVFSVKCLTCNSSNSFRSFQGAPGKPWDVSAEAVANQMRLFKWVTVLHLLGILKLKLIELGNPSFWVWCWRKIYYTHTHSQLKLFFFL